MSPHVLALAAAGGVALVLLAVAGAVLGWRRARDRDLTRRIRRTAAPLTGPGPVDEEPNEESIFRPADKRTWLTGVRAFIETRYPFLEARRALPTAFAAGVAGAAGGWFSMWFLKVPAGWWTVPVVALAGVAVGGNALKWLQARQEAEFVRQFPEIVDQIVRLAGAGVPALEALATVADDAPNPVAPVLGSVRDGLLAGLDADTTLRLASDRVRIAEFSLFAAVIRLQRRAGGGISSAFRNLAETLRERRKTALKAQASTAQTRLTLIILSVMPIIVLVSQKFIAPQSLEILFRTDQGTMLLRWGLGLVVAGLLAARGIAARAAR